MTAEFFDHNENIVIFRDSVLPLSLPDFIICPASVLRAQE